MSEEIKYGPTGRTRYRAYKPFFGPSLLVLQLEERVPSNEGTSHFDDWRDAATEDLTTATVEL